MGSWGIFGQDVPPEPEAKLHHDLNFDLDQLRQFEFEEDQNDVTFELYSIINNRKWWYTNLVMPKIVWESLRGGLDLWQFFIPNINIPVAHLKNNLSALNECTFVEQSIAELLQSGVVKTVTYKPHCINPLTVAYRKCKKRLCLDLSRSVNPFINKTKFKLDGLPTLSQTFSTGFHFFTFDIKR